jgi:hypothetical protein
MTTPVPSQVRIVRIYAGALPVRRLEIEDHLLIEVLFPSNLITECYRHVPISRPEHALRGISKDEAWDIIRNLIETWDKLRRQSEPHELEFTSDRQRQVEAEIEPLKGTVREAYWALRPAHKDERVDDTILRDSTAFLFCEHFRSYLMKYGPKPEV